MRTNDPSDNDSNEPVHRVRVRRVRVRPGRVRRVGGPVKLRLPWRVWLLIGALALAGLAIFVLIVGVLFTLLPFLLLAAAALMVVGWLRSVLGGPRRRQ